jgi:hypothetical protein
MLCLLGNGKYADSQARSEVTDVSFSQSQRLEKLRDAGGSAFQIRMRCHVHLEVVYGKETRNVAICNIYLGRLRKSANKCFGHWVTKISTPSTTTFSALFDHPIV